MGDGFSSDYPKSGINLLDVGYLDQSCRSSRGVNTARTVCGNAPVAHSFCTGEHGEGPRGHVRTEMSVTTEEMKQEGN
jgi:hypothetical protein